VAAMPKRKELDDLIGTTDASHILMISTETVRALAKRGELEAIPVSGRMSFRRADVERLAAERRKGPKATLPKE
jgi:hypothetical protein